MRCISRRNSLPINSRSIRRISRRSIRRISLYSIVRTGRSLSRKGNLEQPLADFLVRKLNEVGAMSRDDLWRLALQEGYFAGADADRGMHNTLLNVVKAGLIRQLSNGNFAPATVLDTIQLRRAM